mmetsp:Transcript_34555/g.90142  ORF Transcript_34555/g.90142 Transcript_34555/m.90142 type:complete len:218 (-) Transcript_34555:1330-1983(-)
MLDARQQGFDRVSTATPARGGLDVLRRGLADLLGDAHRGEPVLHDVVVGVDHGHRVVFHSFRSCNGNFLRRRKILLADVLGPKPPLLQLTMATDRCPALSQIRRSYTPPALVNQDKALRRRIVDGSSSNGTSDTQVLSTPLSTLQPLAQLLQRVHLNNGPSSVQQKFLHVTHAGRIRLRSRRKHLDDVCDAIACQELVFHRGHQADSSCKQDGATQG